MKIINLRDYYPFYTQDTLLEVSDEVAQAMAEAERLERNYMRRMFYNKAQYSLDADDGIEASATECHILSPEAVLILPQRKCTGKTRMRHIFLTEPSQAMQTQYKR